MAYLGISYLKIKEMIDLEEKIEPSHFDYLLASN